MKKKEYPACFGILENVFPMGENGLRNTPESCFPCYFKVECLRTVMSGKEGLGIRENNIDRAYDSGMMGFWERWSKKKILYQRKKRKTKKSPK
jgi:hypothetical protein